MVVAFFKPTIALGCDRCGHTLAILALFENRKFIFYTALNASELSDAWDKIVYLAPWGRNSLR
jgi:hypothetical protein